MAFCVCALAFLAACAPLADAVGAWGAMGQSLAHAWRPAAGASDWPAGFEYMQVQVDGRSSLLVLGRRLGPAPGVVPGTDADADTDEFWYSPQSEMLHLRNGRLWRALGMTAEWRRQQSSPPAWRDVPAQALGWVRRVDRMPGYRWAEQDELHTRALPSAPAGADARVGTLWPGAQWFEDAVQSWTAQGQPWAYTQHFAVWQGQVVYSRQCLAPEVCLALTRWPQGSGQ